MEVLRRVNSELLLRATGCLAGLAVGDAMGMAVEFMTREEIRKQFRRVDRFLQPLPGHVHTGTPAGRVTDDTEQTWALARALLASGRITPRVAADAYLEWADRTNAFETSFLGPSSRSALERLRSGEDPTRTGEKGATVGAAMRVAPIGIVNAGDPAAAANEAYLSSLPTHGVNIAIAGACALAAGVACAVAGGSLDAVVEAVLAGAATGQRLGVQWAGATVPARMMLALDLVRRYKDEPEKAEEALYETVGVGMCPAELVATALGLVVLYDGRPRAAIPAAASMGGDTDTLAAMVGALSGALGGIDALPPDWVTTVERMNDLNCEILAKQLIEARARRLEAGDVRRDES
ncbi:MAG: ADP-ribosylglycohydrolase family protein [Firmicutes bacterium]|jgi:ADP-ribosylglycohydrolase|nr:ADP-ribosylglycohydrolase family protein [Bacillota bacterium]MDH7495294.1 ADP-ribosylglycohydrolase family protein [Bacillota bacterium]